MEFLGAFFGWIGSNESILSGIAAAIVILGVVYTAARTLFRRRFTADERPSTAPSPSVSATASTPASASASPEAGPALHTSSPSIAVMPFANLSGDPAHEFLADGLTEDIILGLSRVKQLFVIARNSCFTYKGTVPDAAVVSRELGVRYVLEGSIRKAGDRIRVTAQLVDARTRTQKWAERFDRKLEEILEVDDEVTEAIVAALQPALRRVEAEQARRAAPGDLTAWALVNQAWVAVASDLSDASVAHKAIESCEQALVLDPDYAFAHAVLAHAKSLLVHEPECEHYRSQVMVSIDRALELGADDALVHHCHAALLGNLGQTRDAAAAWERAIELDPNNAGARAGLGITKIFLHHADEALPLIDSALRRSPADSLQYYWLGYRAWATMLMGDLSEARKTARMSLQRNPSRLGYAVYATALAHEECAEEARSAYPAMAALLDERAAAYFAGLCSALASDPEWGKIIARDALRTACD